jgi:DNA-binding NarL/FixJ family response regulator
MRLFIADDSEILRIRLIAMLSEIEGIEIIGQSNITLDAIDSIQKLNPHVVILDIRLPQQNGIKVLETIKKNNQPPKVIIFTNYPYPPYRKRCMDAGADFFFDKSTEYENLIDTVKHLIRSSSQTKQTI